MISSPRSNANWSLSNHGLSNHSFACTAGLRCIKYYSSLFIFKLMNIILTEIEARVLGTLVEKNITTPDYYPLSLNALVNSCNQRNNRDPGHVLARGRGSGRIEWVARTRTGGRGTAQ